MRLLEASGAAGLMLARGAIADPWLFQRLRGNQPATIPRAKRQQELCEYLRSLSERYCQLFDNETLVMFRLKDVLNHIQDEWFEDSRRALRRSKSLGKFRSILATLE